MSDVTRILSQIEAGDPRAAEQLLPLVYEELRKLAVARLTHEKPGQTLQATARVHEAYLRLVGGEGSGVADKEPPGWNSRGHFFGAAAEAMRRSLVDQARRKEAKKRGGDRQQIELADLPAAEPGSAVDLLALDQALTEFAAIDPRAAKLVKLRYFAGLTGQKAADPSAFLTAPPIAPGLTPAPGCSPGSSPSDPPPPLSAFSVNPSFSLA